MARSDFGFQIGSALATNYLTDSKFIRASYIVVNTIAERDALPVDTGSGGVIVKGSLCYVSDEDKFYQYSDEEWIQWSAPGGSTVTVELYTDPKIHAAIETYQLVIS